MLDMRWDQLSTTTMWIIWKRRCQYLYEGACEPPAKTIMAIWLEITHNLYGQLQELQGNSKCCKTKKSILYHLGFYAFLSTMWRYAEVDITSTQLEIPSSDILNPLTTLNHYSFAFELFFLAININLEIIYLFSSSIVIPPPIEGPNSFESTYWCFPTAPYSHSSIWLNSY